MADFQAIGGVSATLQTLLLDRMRFPAGILQPGQDVAVTVDAPPHYEPSNGAAPAEDPQVNLFLYRMTENGFLKNQEIPGHGSPGAYGSPPLGLELHYLLSAYGRTSRGADIGDSKLAHILMGNAMRVFHDHAVVTERLTRQVQPVVGEPVLDQRLFGEYEQVKLYLHSVSLDDLTKVWTALAQPFRLSAAYMVSVVQIESRRPRRFPKPVGEPPPAGPRIAVVTLTRPEITELRALRGGVEHPYPYARVDDRLVIIGRGFAGGAVHVALGDLQIPVAPLRSERIEVIVPDFALPPPDGSAIPPDQRLQPGVHTVRVRISAEAMSHVAFESNQAVFMLVPAITAVALVPPGAGPATPRKVRIGGTRLWSERLPGQTVVGTAVVQAESYTTAGPLQIEVPLPDTLPYGSVRCRMGGDASGFGGTGANSPELEVRIGAAGPFHTVSLPPLNDVEDAARLLGPAVAAVGGPGYDGARTGLLQSPAGEQRLLFVPGWLSEQVSFQKHAADNLADDLQLTAAASTQTGLLSGQLDPFPRLSASAPRLQVTIDGVARQVSLGARPTTLADAAVALQAGIRGAAAGDPNFAVTYVAILGKQLLLLPGFSKPVSVGPVAGVDETTVGELQLSVRLPLRVRVNGAESVDDALINLP